MVAKRSSRALALLLALPSAAFALGLGDIRLLSPLNAPLDAEVELVDVAPDEVNTVQAQLASRETFARYGLDWPAYLANVQVHVRNKDGRQILKLTSTGAISEPFITLLIEVGWSHGHLVREYTVLLDPPVYTPGQSSAASAPVTAPAAGGGAREGAIERSAQTPAATMPANEPAATPAAPEPTAPEPVAAARSAPATGGESAVPSAHVVQRGETLSGIASGVAGANANSPHTRSWMLAIYQANPRAFQQNMNVLHSGAVLRIPDAAQAAAVSPSEASAEIRRQYAAWHSASGGEAAGGSQPGRLKLVTPTESSAAGASATAGSAEIGKLQGRVHDLEGQLAESKRLLELRNADLAHMQAQLAAKNAPAPAPTPPAPAARETPPPAPAPSAEQAKPEPQPAEQPPAQAAPPPEAAPAPVAATSEGGPTTGKNAPAPAAGGSLLDSLTRYWWIAAVLLLGLLAAVAARIMRSRRAQQFDDSLGRLAVAGGSVADTGGFAMRREPAIAEEPAHVATGTDPAFLVEESGSHERPRTATAGVAPAAATPRHVTSDETISSDTAINLDQGDPLAEADFHMAYGLYDQAADLIRIAISREPERRDLKLKLLEVFFVWGNKEQFLQTARELAESRDRAAPGEWEKILIMGKQLAPEDALFAAGAVSGATAGGVDLDLEGGQSRVDFDLLGEPSAPDASSALDLDIGAAVGDHALSDSPTNITDRNAALEGTMASRTGTTRQMTAHLRHDPLQVTGEIEGPTVEQPAMAATAEHPTIRQKVETALKQSGPEQTAELALDDLGLDVGHGDTLDQPTLASGAEAPTLVAGLDDTSRQAMEKAHSTTVSTGQWQFDQAELEAALTQTSLRVAEVTPTERIAAFGANDVDVDVGTASDTTGTHPAAHTGVDVDVGAATGTHAAISNGGALDLDVGTATVPDAAFAATQRLSSADLALPDLEPVTMSEVGTKLDLARAYMDMGDPDGARNILEEVLAEGSAVQKQEAQRLIESLPG